LLPCTEQNQVYNSINFNYNLFCVVNTTAVATSLNYLHCPSDPSIENKVFIAGGTIEGTDMTMCYSSYGGCAGTWFQLPRYTHSFFNERINQQIGVIIYIGYENVLVTPEGMFTGKNRGMIRLAAVTDGTSNTFMYS